MYTEHAKRKTVTVMDVVYAVKRQGNNEMVERIGCYTTYVAVDEKHLTKFSQSLFRRGMVEQLKAQFEEALQKYKEIENGESLWFLMLHEFEYLDEDAKVYKLIGACLVRQDIPEAKANVDKRLEYINAEIKAVIFSGLKA
ncbi:prefoldin subunit [Ancylostoma duodenale]|uniref:Histone H4 n=1 Tax=Ancylostoma duodenale TaxID=51022 RepID=A0A0C2CCR8_9BILA|nr:prefoldin subunit [Ancylostoma duodenale]